MRYAIRLSYMGTHYSGWQRQPDATTVEGIITLALFRLLREEITLVGCGRTDTGVHAQNYVAHFDLTKEIEDSERILYKLNAMLPKDIAIHSLVPCSEDFHARFSATWRSYEYRILRAKSPLWAHAAYYYPWPLDVEAMQRAAAQLVEFNDFASFCKRGSDPSSTLCKVAESHWKVEDEMLLYRITANRFLRNMVRAIVGTLLDVGRGRKPEDLRGIMERCDRCAAGESAPPEGLHLVKIVYPDAPHGL